MAPLLGMIGGKLFDKFIHFEHGGQVRVKHGKKGLAVIHDGEMIVRKKDVEKTKRAMRAGGVAVPKPRTISGPGATRGRGKRR